MTEGKHTPLPWRVVNNSIQSDLGYVADLSSPRGPDERDANAELIVRSVNSLPALVKALEDLLNATSWNALYRARDQARNVLEATALAAHRWKA